MERRQKYSFRCQGLPLVWRPVSVLIFFLFLVGCGTTPSEPEPKEQPEPIQKQQNTRNTTHEKWHLSARTQHTFGEVGSDTDPAVSPDGEWLYFVSNRNNNNFDLYRKSLTDSTPVQRLTTSRCDERLPAVFPGSSEKVAVARNKTGNWDIWILHLENGQNWEQVTDLPSEEAWPSWSPDGTRLAYSQYINGQKKWKTWIKDLSKNRTASAGSGYWVDWNPRNDNQIALIDHRRRKPNMFFLETFTLPSTRRFQLQQSRDWAVSSPTWSPNGQFIVFASVMKSKRARSENRFWKGDDIWMVKADGTGLTQLTDTSEPEWFPVWGPNNRIYYLRENNGVTNIYSVPGPEEGTKMPKENY